MSYDSLSRLGVTCRPIEQWPGTLTRHRNSSPFRSSLSATMELLERELRQLSARQIVLQLAISEQDIRLDGLPYARARAEHPGVILAFESRHGPLQFAVDQFHTWSDNLRAIALGMEALRKVDRYGITRNAEQYTGWKQLPMSTDPTRFPSAEAAAEFLEVHGGYKIAARRFHPDNQETGDELMFKKVVAARDLVKA